MGLSPYSNPADVGLPFVILVNTVISISKLKEKFCSIFHTVGIPIASWEEYSIDGPSNSTEYRGCPSDSYMDEFHGRTPTVRFDTVCGCNRPEQECSVCLTEFKPDAEINHLSCGHVFHKSCLEKWLKHWNVTCPLCRNCMMHQEDDKSCPM